jgi:citrate synthase
MLLATVSLPSIAEAQRAAWAPDRAARELAADLEQVEAEAATNAAVLRRDAFIVAQFAAASGALQDFQKNAAVQKALDRVDAAARRAAERPQAEPEVFRIIRKAKTSLDDAKERGFSTDFAALQRDVETASRDLQPWVFRDIIAMQKLRVALADVQSRVSRMTQDLDAATGEVLASTLEDARE